jgi:hypothetical protein
LSYEVLGLLCLGVLWANTLVVAAAAWKELRTLSALRARRARLRLLVVAFIVGELLACAFATRLALWPPVFGRVSTIGGVLCLAFFLAVTPVGVWVRDRCRPPSRAVSQGAGTEGADGEVQK